MIQMVNEWMDNGGISNFADGTDPNLQSVGTVVTAQAGGNAYGAYAQLLSATAFETFWIDICFNTCFVSAENLKGVVTIGVDTAGGSSYVDTINHLLCGKANYWFDAGEWQTAGGLCYSFPLRIPAGASVGAKASFNSTASRSTMNVAVKLRGKPSRPELVWAGSGVETLGTVSATTFGTAITPGTASEGAWTSIGTPTKKWKYADWGIGFDTAASDRSTIEVDLGLGDGSNKRVVSYGGRAFTATQETVRKDPRQGSWITDIGGATAYMRMQGSGNVPTNLNAALYGVY